MAKLLEVAKKGELKYFLKRMFERKRLGDIISEE